MSDLTGYIDVDDHVLQWASKSQGDTVDNFHAGMSTLDRLNRAIVTAHHLGIYDKLVQKYFTGYDTFDDYHADHWQDTHDSAQIEMHEEYQAAVLEIIAKQYRENSK